MDEQIHGLSLRDCARINAKHTELRAQYGEAQLEPHLAAFMAEVGTDRDTWARSWNAWWARMESDPSGQLHAEHARHQQEFVLAAHMGDVPDASQDTREGVSLEQYAMLMARIAGGEDAEAVIASAGVPLDRWLAAQTAWNAAMGEIEIATQYGLLYAKHSPGFQQQLDAQVAQTMADDYERRAAGEPDTEEEEYTFEIMVKELEDPTPNTRWTAAHHVCNQWDIGDHADPALHAAAERAYALAHECLLRHDEFTVSNAEALARDLAMFAGEGFLTAEQAADSKHAIARCLEAGRDHLQTVRDAFAPIQDKRVPERIRLQSAIQDYESLEETLTDLVDEWDDTWRQPSQEVEGAPHEASGGSDVRSPTSPSPGPLNVQPPATSSPFLMVLRGLPMVGPLIRMLGL